MDIVIKIISGILATITLTLIVGILVIIEDKLKK